MAASRRQQAGVCHSQTRVLSGEGHLIRRACGCATHEQVRCRLGSRGSCRQDCCPCARRCAGGCRLHRTQGRRYCAGGCGRCCRHRLSLSNLYLDLLVQNCHVVELQTLVSLFLSFKLDSRSSTIVSFLNLAADNFTAKSENLHQLLLCDRSTQIGNIEVISCRRGWGSITWRQAKLVQSGLYSASNHCRLRGASICAPLCEENWKW
mmetsp:Transcript_9583/g.35117  ORF Transcript_9583/g.35117 Transcript_9583/m.35117 type:complete len:207 (-) Transcript_9583:707-1327(-)